MYAATETVQANGIDDLTSIAEVLFSRYMLPFEAASLLLLSTMIGVIALAKRDRRGHVRDQAPLGLAREARARGARAREASTTALALSTSAESSAAACRR